MFAAALAYRQLLDRLKALAAALAPPGVRVVAVVIDEVPRARQVMCAQRVDLVDGQSTRSTSPPSPVPSDRPSPRREPCSTSGRTHVEPSPEFQVFENGP